MYSLKKVRNKNILFSSFCISIFLYTFAPAIRRIAEKEVNFGALAQLVEHRTENPCVPGSIPGGTTPPFIMNPARVFGL